MNERELRKLESRIRKNMRDIKSGETTPKESGIGTKMNILKKYDEALFEKIIVEYKEILTTK